MKKLLIIFIACFIFNPAYADKIQGHFYCEYKFPDGSGESTTLKINMKKMLYRDTSYSGFTEYKEVYYSDVIDKQYTIFVMAKNYSQMVIFLSPTKKKNKVSFTKIFTDTSRKEIEKTVIIGQGMCDRI